MQPWVPNRVDKCNNNNHKNTCNLKVASKGKLSTFMGAFRIADSLIECLGTTWIFVVSKAPEKKIRLVNYLEFYKKSIFADFEEFDCLTFCDNSKTTSTLCKQMKNWILIFSIEWEFVITYLKSVILSVFIEGYCNRVKYEKTLHYDGLGET